MKQILDGSIERRNSGSLKWDSLPTGTERGDLIPLWVADMDFPAPDAVKNALSNRVAHGIYGYGLDWAGFEQAIVSWMERRHGWHIDPEHVVPVPGVMNAVSLLIDELTEPGEGVIIQPPVYPPFKRMPNQLNRRVIENPLERENGRYHMDFDGLSAACEAGAGLALFCSPHNPVGRVWSAEELSEAISICAAADVAVVVDEIHCDILPWDHRFTPSQTLGSQGVPVVSVISPTKTFNLAGIATGAALIADETLRDRYRTRLHMLSLNLPNVLSSVAAVAAYREGDTWLDGVLTYVKDNAEYVGDRLSSDLTSIAPNQPEGTYLMWLDFSATGLDDDGIKNTLLNRAGVWLNHGPYFGTGGVGFQRLNLACPQPVLAAALDRMVPVFQRLGKSERLE